MLVEKVQARVCGSRVFGEIEALNDCTVSKVTRQLQAFGCDCMKTQLDSVSSKARWNPKLVNLAIQRWSLPKPKHHQFRTGGK